MRVAPIGFLYQHDLPKLRQVAAASALVTHHHPAAQLGAVAAAFLAKLALDRLPPEEMLPALELETHGQVRDFDQALARLEEALEMASPDAALAHIGEGWVAEEAVLMALYCFLKSPDDFLATIRQGANTQGDSDSIACIAGGISGAYLGIGALPAAWVARLEKSEYLADVAHRLAAVRAPELNEAAGPHWPGYAELSRDRCRSICQPKRSWRRQGMRLRDKLFSGASG